jgi:hypothetical protein
MTLASKVFLFAFLLACLGFAAWLIHHELRIPQNEREVMDRVIELMQEGRYDKAVQIVQAWIKDPRRDTSHDGSLYQEMAIAYIAKANRALTGRSEAIRQAELNIEKQLNLYNKENVISLRLDLFEISKAHEVLGDLSDKDKCLYYGMAEQELDRQSSLIHGDFYEADGRKFPLAPVRRDINKHLDAVKEKASKAGCPSADKKS